MDDIIDNTLRLMGEEFTRAVDLPYSVTAYQIVPGLTAIVSGPFRCNQLGAPLSNPKPPGTPVPLAK